MGVRSVHVRWCLRFVGLATIAATCLLEAYAGAATPTWPVLPANNGEVTVPVQEWPWQPGPREAKVYIHYPGGLLTNVATDTGLMLSLHNWGGTYKTGTADPEQLADRYNVIAICVDYLQSGPFDSATGPPYDFGYLQALDSLRGLYSVWHGLEATGRPFARGRIYATGGSGGGNVTLMVNKLAPRTFACIIDMCGMAKLSDDIAFGIPGRTHLSAGYSQDPGNRSYLTPGDQALRFVGYPDHVKTMKALGNAAKVIIVHGTDDKSCPVEDAREMAENMRVAGLDVEPHFIGKDDIDGKAVKNTEHSIGDRTQVVFQFADAYLKPGLPTSLMRKGMSDFEARDEKVRYSTPDGSYVISYKGGYPEGRFEASSEK